MFNCQPCHGEPKNTIITPGTPEKLSLMCSLNERK
jgi:hypothetical protein